ncbi:hypothetical protein ARMSODRAFT_981861 [Armillaria solidipes]|uniref:Uncharacterized protein n=1 Tax=Armillaria solidipes TaxID=1076256 RepID=A0A2H3B4L9_9AGAR|nr:hypothetical protein ARMSODRAFT_981861 [Armillaria solidipes]
MTGAATGFTESLVHYEGKPRGADIDVRQHEIHLAMGEDGLQGQASRVEPTFRMLDDETGGVNAVAGELSEYQGNWRISGKLPRRKPLQREEGFVRNPSRDQKCSEKACRGLAIELGDHAESNSERWFSPLRQNADDAVSGVRGVPWASFEESDWDVMQTSKAEQPSFPNRHCATLLRATVASKRATKRGVMWWLCCDRLLSLYIFRSLSLWTHAVTEAQASKKLPDAIPWRTSRLRQLEFEMDTEASERLSGKPLTVSYA